MKPTRGNSSPQCHSTFAFFGVIAILVIVYIVLVDAAKRWFLRQAALRPMSRPDTSNVG